MLVVAGGLVLGTGLLLTFLPERTETTFAWTINPPLTAAFLGSGYLASAGFQWVAARRREWASARVAVTATLVFTILTSIATALHFDRFHYREGAVASVVVTWAWIVIYVGVPVIMSGLLVMQLRRRGGDPPRTARFPWPFHLLLGTQAAVMIGVGTALYVVPTTAATLWPWTLTPLTGRAVGAWLVGLGVAALHSMWENDWNRVRPTIAGNAGLTVFHAIALARFTVDVDWGRPAAWAYVAFLATMAVTSTYAVAALVRTRRAAAAAPRASVDAL
jgi:hypothetical protein